MMATRSLKTGNVVTVENDNWHEQINILKQMYPHISNPELVGREIKAGRLQYNKIMDWHEGQIAHIREE